MSVAIGYVPGAFGQGGENPTFLRQLVELGDQYGYDSIWLSDRIVGHQFSLEPMIALSMVAAYSDKLKFGTSVIYVEAGASKFVVRPLCPGDESIDQLEMMGQDILPLFHT
ncbi:hypothetical protein C2W62_00100 [Candidatus Entotheonella serta]|nr:hypothetical protein C2W62_00100 [Candidatus Entotheonella serta]